MNVNPHDPLVDIFEAARRMGVNLRRARNILVRNQIQPVRGRYGIQYRQADVDAVRRMYK